MLKQLSAELFYRFPFHGDATEGVGGITELITGHLAPTSCLCGSLCFEREKTGRRANLALAFSLLSLDDL